MTEGAFKAILIDGQLHEVRPDGSLAPFQDLSDWARVDAMSKEKIERIAAEDEESPPLTDEEWEVALESAKGLGLGRFSQHPAKARG